MGSRLGFCQLHIVDTGVDTGDILQTKEFLYPPSCRVPEDYMKVYFEKNKDFVEMYLKR